MEEELHQKVVRVRAGSQHAQSERGQRRPAEVFNIKDIRWLVVLEKLPFIGRYSLYACESRGWRAQLELYMRLGKRQPHIQVSG